jgi:hypothetical protein
MNSQLEALQPPRSRRIRYGKRFLADRKHDGRTKLAFALSGLQALTNRDAACGHAAAASAGCHGGRERVKSEGPTCVRLVGGLRLLGQRGLKSDGKEKRVVRGVRLAEDGEIRFDTRSCGWFINGERKIGGGCGWVSWWSQLELPMILKFYVVFVS